MEWIEVIMVRFSRQEDVERLLFMLQQIEEASGPDLQIDIYNVVGVESDLITVLRHRSTTAKPEKSWLGRMIVKEFQSCGLANHMLWEKQAGKNSDSAEEIGNQNE